jgi:tetratricopeptide (TPR) repeat protein
MSFCYVTVATTELFVERDPISRFLNHLILHHGAHGDEDVFEEFFKLETDVERYRYIADLEPVRSYDFDQLSNLRRDESDATSLRAKEEGNRSYKKMKFGEALAAYNRCILYAASEESLAVGYSNRSALLIETGRMAEALLDVDRSLGLKHPEHLTHKLHLRKAKILLANGHLQEAKVHVQTGKSLLPTGVSGAAFDALGSQLCAHGSLEPQKFETDCEKRKNRVRSNLDKILANFVPHEKYPSASSSLEYRETSNKRCGFFAARDILPGELPNREPRDGFNRLVVSVRSKWTSPSVK